MFDFSKMDQAFTAMGELDTLLRSILAEQRTTNVMLGMLIRAAEGSNVFDVDRAMQLVRDATAIANGPDSRT